jgi:hypothetical protein
VGENNFFSSFKVTLKILFFGIKICKNFMAKKLEFKSIGDNFKIANFLFFNGFVKNTKKMTFLQISRLIKK